MESQSTGAAAAALATRALRIRGHVQGVGFRWALCEQARALGLAGWVRNRLDGSVEALICGPMEAVTALADWAHRGPPGARVTAVEMHAAETAGPLAGFEQVPTI